MNEASDVIFCQGLIVRNGILNLYIHIAKSSCKHKGSVLFQQLESIISNSKEPRLTLWNTGVQSAWVNNSIILSLLP